ncbi:hypothetical protein SLEP1_g31921 [Rubroshorea leprosula]|uniref:Vacuolar protein sorting-associated protein 62 n=1 Tax=Rubroshorea leprosula TaxID=152421 RepID=A0AAV5KBS9_9ROSI|nr:hypothetical protein SLEP1_g31921 [Rubroshorea leprosula]
MGNCLPLPWTKSKALPIETLFRLPSPLPTWPPSEGFGSGVIDLGGLLVRQLSSFTKIWATYQGGPDDLGATFFEPSEMPEGFFLLGCYSQPNNKPLFGWVLVAKDDSTDASLLAKPVDYTLVWSSESLNMKKDGNAYFWLPTPRDGYKTMGHVITNSPEKPSLDKIRCVRSDFTDGCEADTWIWGPQKNVNETGFNVFSVRPSIRGSQAMGVSVGTFAAGNGNGSVNLACLKNAKSDLSYMPNLHQIEILFQAYSPWIYFHPNEKHLPSSVSWYFIKGALLYKKGEESNPVVIEPTGANLPQGGSNDGAYWLDLPVDEGAKERVKKGDLSNSQAYLHVKPMLGATFTDMAIWVFYPFNGPARAKVEFINVDLGKIAELEFQGGNKPVSYSSLNGHAIYSKPGLVLQGSSGIGIRNDTAKSTMLMDTGRQFSVVAADHLGSTVTEPPWLNYFRGWGPKISYNIDDQIKTVEKALPGKLKSVFEKAVKSIPKEVLGEEGPTGPKVKANWTGDEI